MDIHYKIIFFLYTTIRNVYKADMSVWKVGPANTAKYISIVTHYPQKIEQYHGLLRGFEEFLQMTIEIHHCTTKPCMATQRGKGN